MATLVDLATRWAREGQIDPATVRELERGDEPRHADGDQVDRDAALRALHEMPEDDQPWRSGVAA